MKKKILNNISISKQWTLIAIIVVSCLLSALVGVGIYYLGEKINSKSKLPADYYSNSSCKIYGDENNATIDLDYAHDLDVQLKGQWRQHIEDQLPNGIMISKQDDSFIKACPAQMEKKASAASIQSFNLLNDQEHQNYSDYDDCKRKIQLLNPNAQFGFDNLTYESDSIKTIYKSQLTSFFNILTNVYGINDVSHFFWDVEPVAVISNDFTIAQTSFYYNAIVQCVLYTPSFCSIPLILQNYQSGWMSSKSLISITVHEFGHVLSNYFWTKKEHRNNLLNGTDTVYPTSCAGGYQDSLRNQEVLRNNNYRYQYSLSPNDYFVQWMANKVGISSSNKQWAKLFAMSVVQSGYGRSAGNSELFAEGFAQWLLTPDNQKGQNWQILNEFFRKALIEKYDSDTMVN